MQIVSIKEMDQFENAGYYMIQHFPSIAIAGYAISNKVHSLSYPDQDPFSL